MMMKGCRLIQDFILPALRNKTFGENLKWDPNDKCVFMLKWIHKAKSSWSEHDAAVFLAWDKIKHRPEPKTHLDFVNSKQRLRAALRNVKNIEEVVPFNGYRRYKITAMQNLFQNKYKLKIKTELDNKIVDIKPKVKVEVAKSPLQFPIKVKEENIKKEGKEKYENIETKDNPIKVKKENIKKEYENIEAKSNSIKVNEEDINKEIKEEYESIERKNKIYSLRDRSAKRIVYYQSESEEEFDIANKTMPDENKVAMAIIKKEPNDVKKEIQGDMVVPENNNAVTEKEEFIEVSVPNSKKDDVKIKSPVRCEKARRQSEIEVKKISTEDLPERKGLKRNTKKKRAKAVRPHTMSHRNAYFSSVFHKNSSILKDANQVNDGSLAQKERAVPMNSPVYRSKTMSLNRENIKQTSGQNNLILCDQKFNPLNSKTVINGAVKFDKSRKRKGVKNLPMNNGVIIGELSDTLKTGASSDIEIRDAREWPAKTPETALPVSEEKLASKGDNEAAAVAGRSEEESATPETGESSQGQLWYTTKWPPESVSKHDVVRQDENDAEKGEEEPYPNFFDPETELTALLEYANNTFLHPMTEKDIEDYKKYLQPLKDGNWEKLFPKPPPGWKPPILVRDIDTQIPEKMEEELNSILKKINEMNIDEYLNMDFLYPAKFETV